MKRDYSGEYIVDELPDDPIGAGWLARHFDILPLGRFPVLSQIGARRSSKITDGYRLETYPENMRPGDQPAEHLQFHLRHEVLHLEFLGRLFQKVGPTFIQAWIDSEPNGQYAKRAAFLYEWITADNLRVPDNLGRRYVDVIDSEKLVASSPEKTINNARWRVRDNLPGTRHFCPLIVKNDEVVRASDLDVRALYDVLSAEFGEDLLIRAAVWMTLRESRASFAIEGEADQTSRVKRFADVMARRTGQGDFPLTDKLLATLQKEILGTKSTVTHFGLRQSPVFVGEVLNFQEIVHYVAPPAEDMVDMLAGLQTFLDKTSGQSSVMRGAVAAFGFIYIHPLADGNGRVHRFLINDVLRRDGVVPDQVILPVSAMITDDPGQRRYYDRILDLVSVPLMMEIRDDVELGTERVTYPDGVDSNFKFLAEDKARPLWRYPNLSPHVIFVAQVISRTLTEQMRDEARYLRNHIRARTAMKEIVEMPDHMADRVLRSIAQNQGQLSHVLAKEIPILAQPGIWADIVVVVTKAFQRSSLD
jgi:hypothetical protein